MAKGEFEEIRDVPYCRCGGTCDDMFPKHQLDLYLPKVALPTRRPVVVFVHGGSWIRGDRRAYRHFFSSYDTNLLVALIMYYYGTYWNVGRAFAKSGIACAVISYRLSRLGFPWVFLELFASMLMSLGIIILPVIMLACFAFGFLALLGFSIAPHWYVQSVASAVILISLIVLWILVCFEDKLYSITFLKKISPFTALTVTGILGLVFDIGRDTFLLHLTACFAVCLSLHFLKFKDRPFVTHPDHITDVALSVRWVKTYGETSGRYNANEIFVCGHSAGGHMVSLLALDKKFLQGVRLSPEDIKGVISISGVYNLKYLASTIMEHLILRPAFGNNVTTWHDASPFYCISRQVDSTDDGNRRDKKLSFLIINAEKDFHLTRDARLFIQKLEEFGHKCQHVTIKGVNHFSIAATFGRPAPVKGEPAVHEICCRFIWDTLQS